MTLTPDAAAIAIDLSGRAKLEALMASDLQPGIVGLLGLELVGVGDGTAAFEGTPSRAVYNPIGTVHGGYAAALLDSACGCAVQSSLNARQRYTTLELKVAYHRSMTEATGRVRAEGRIVSIGKRAAFAEATLKGPDGRLYASATSTLLVFEA